MHVRKTLNSLLHSSGYQLAKVVYSEPSTELPLWEILDDKVLAARVAPERKHAWIVAAPKSGSTWLSVVLEQLLGWPSVPMNRGDRGEHEVDMRQILCHPQENILSPHQHCKASPITVQFIKQFRVKPIIQVRNIFDTVISFRDHCLKEGFYWPMAYIDKEFLQLSEDQQFHFIIDMVIPWFFNFYASWLKAGTELDALFVEYNELLEDMPGVLHKILDYLGETRTQAEMDAAMESVNHVFTRKNSGISGRGTRLLNDQHKAKIRAFRQYYPHIDFAMLGC